MKPLRALGAGALLLLAVAAPAPAEDTDPFSSWHSREPLIVCFDRAERAGTLQEWLRIMELPMAGVPEWERERVQGEYELRLAGWLRRAWGQGLPKPDLASFLGAVESAGLRHLFQSEPSGRILRDALGDPVLRPPEEFESDHALWRRELGGAVSELIGRWERGAEVMFHETLGLLDPDSRAALAGNLQVTLAGYCAEVRREFERLYGQAESRFLKARLRDRYSLRAKSESRTAGELARELVGRTQGELDQALRSLELGPEVEHRETTMALDAARWQEQFQRELERGLEAWNRAEQDFLSQRISWETDAREAFVRAEESWDQAFGEFERARRLWAAEMSRCLNEGRVAWDLAEEDFARQYTAVATGLAASARAELVRLNDEVGVYLKVHRQSLEMIDLAESSIRFLTGEIAALRRERGGSDTGVGRDLEDTLAVLVGELAYWQGEDGGGGVLARYREAADLASRSLLDLEARIRGYGGDGLPAASLERELLRLQVEQEYLIRQVEIAEALVRYARTSSSRRPTEAETAHELAEARAHCAEAESSYGQAAAALERFVRLELEAAPGELTEVREVLALAQEALDQARRRYATAWNAWCVQDVRVVEAMVSQYAEAIEGWHNGGRAEAYRRYFATWEAFSRAATLRQAEELLRDLLGQGLVDRVPDLEELLARSEALGRIRLDWEGVPGEAREAGGEDPWGPIAGLSAAAGFAPAFPEYDELFAAVSAGVAGDQEARALAEYLLLRLQERAALEVYRHERLIELLRRGVLPADQAAGEVAAAREAAELAEAAYQAAREAAPEPLGSGALGGLDPRQHYERWELSALAAERRRAHEARVLADLYDQFGPLLPMLSDWRRTEAEAAWLRVLGTEFLSGDIFALAPLDSAAAVRAFCAEVAALPEAPPYLRDVLARVAALAAAVAGVPRQELALSAAELAARSAAREVVFGGQSMLVLGEDLAQPEFEQAQLELRRLDWLETVAAIEPLQMRLSEDLGDYLGLLAEAFAVYTSTDCESAATELESREAQRAAHAGELSLVDWLDGRQRAEEARAAWDRDFAAYEATVLAPLQRELSVREHEVEVAAEAYQGVLGELAVLSDHYLELRDTLQTLQRRRDEARLRLQQAEEIHDYASSGYPLALSSPEAVLAERRQALERSEETLAMLRHLSAEGPQRAFTERMDPQYRDWKQTESSLLAGLLQLVRAQAVIEGSAADLHERLRSSMEALSRGAAEVFAFFRLSIDDTGNETRETLEFSLDVEALGTFELTDFRRPDEAALAEAVKAYFDGEPVEVSRRLSADAVLWLLDMAGLGDDCASALRQFGLAYYYDTVVQGDLLFADAPGVVVGILRQQSLQLLVGERFLDLGPRWVQVCTGGQEEHDCRYEYRYPEDRLTVEDYLAREARKAYDALSSDPQQNRLYSFFKVMAATGHLAKGVRFLGDDLSDLAVRYVDAKAAALQGSLGQWWKFLISPVLGLAQVIRAQSIQKLRDQMAGCRVSGADDRSEIVAAAAAAHTALWEWAAAGDNLKRLAGGQAGQSIDAPSFLSDLEEQTGEAPEPSVRAAIHEVFAGFDEAQRRNSLNVLQALRRELESRLGYAREQVQAVASQRLETRAVLYHHYQELVYARELEAEALWAAARGLYRDPSFTAEDYRDWELQALRQLEVRSADEESLRLELLAEALVGLMQHRLELMQHSEQERLLLQLRELGDRRLGWERMAAELLAAGSAQWQDSAARLVNLRAQWYRQFEKEYQDKRSLWEGRYLLLQENRDLWVRDSTRNALVAGAEAMACEMGLAVDRLAAESELLFIPDMSVEVPRLEETLRRAFEGGTLGELIERARSLAGRAEDTTLVVAAFLPQLGSPAAAQQWAWRFAADIGEEIYSRAALVTALQMRKAVEQAEQRAVQSIAEANRDLERSLGHTMASAGYAAAGSEYRRRVIIDHSLCGGSEQETQTVPAYRWFVAPRFDLGIDLSRTALEGRSGAYIQALVSLAQENLQKHLKLVFGRTDKDREHWSWAGIDHELRDLFESRMVEFRASAGYNRKQAGGVQDGRYLFHDTEGLFNLHIGYEPRMDKDNPERVKEAGFGELGRLMAAFLRNEARQARGIALLVMPWYNQRLWDDDTDNDGEADRAVRAPSVRSLANIAVSIAATATGQLWLAAAVNLADDFLFTVADVASGYLDSGAALLGFGKQALVSVATTGIGAGMDVLAGASGAFGEGVIGKTLFEGVERLGTHTLAGAINAVEVGADGLSFNTAAFTEAAFGREALAGYAGVIGGTMASSSLRLLNTRDGNRVRYSPTVFRVEQIERLNSLVGGLTASALEYSLAGQTTLNLLNFGDIAELAGWDWFRAQDGAGNRTGAWLRHGLLELSIGGEDAGVRLGPGGTDVSPSTLAAGTVGLIDTLGIAGYKLEGLEGRSTLNAVNLLGYSGSSLNWGLGRAIFQRGVSVEYDDLRYSGGDYVGSRGYVDRSRPDTIVIARELLGGTLESSAQLASLFGHEGTHLLGNRLEASAYMHEGQTYLDLMSQFHVGDGAYLASLSGAILNERNWLASTGERDYAEWFRTDRVLGIRATNPLDVLRRTPVIGSIMGFVATFTEANPYTNTKLPVSATDERRHVLEARKEADRLQGLIAAGALVTSALQAGAVTKSVGEALLKMLPEYNPLNATSWLSAAEIALNYTDVASAVMDALDRGAVRVDRPAGFDRFKTTVLGAERFKDIKGYGVLEDPMIFALAEDAGVPLVLDNRWTDSPELEAQVINELINNFNFVSALYQLGVRDAGVVSDLYYKGIPYSVTDPDGTVWFFNSPGFAEANMVFGRQWTTDVRYVQHKDALMQLRDFNVAHRLIRETTVDARALGQYDALYRRMVEGGIYHALRTSLWNQYNQYELLLFQGLQW